MKNINLEFNIKQQMWHYNDGLQQPNTAGWFTVCENCSLNYAHMLQAYIDSRITFNKKKKDVLDCAFDFKIFLQNLREYNLDIMEMEQNVL